MRDRRQRITFLVVLVNTLLVLLGILAWAWQSRREAKRPLAPTNLTLNVAGLPLVQPAFPEVRWLQ